MSEKTINIFLSYSSEDAFEANLLQFALEVLMKDKKVKVWTFQRDQNKDERDVSKSLKEQIKESIAMIFLLSPSTLDDGLSQWMELGYSDAYDIPTFILLHRLTHDDLLEGREISLLLSRQLNEAREWKLIVPELHKIIGGGND